MGNTSLVSMKGGKANRGKSFRPGQRIDTAPVYIPVKIQNQNGSITKGYERISILNYINSIYHLVVVFINREAHTRYNEFAIIKMCNFPQNFPRTFLLVDPYEYYEQQDDDDQSNINNSNNNNNNNTTNNNNNKQKKTTKTNKKEKYLSQRGKQHCLFGSKTRLITEYKEAHAIRQILHLKVPLSSSSSSSSPSSSSEDIPQILIIRPD